MSLVRVKIKLLVIALIMFNSVYAIDLSVTSGNISPGTIPSFSSYTLSFDINNQGMPPAVTPEEAIFGTILISGYDITNIGTIINHTPGWTCSDNAGTIGCDRAYTSGEFPFGTTQPFFIDISTNSIVVNPDTFTIDVSDEGVVNEDNFADNTIMISSVAAGIPDFDFVDGATQLSYPGVENQAAPILIDFSVDNLGTEASSGASINIFHDDFLFSVDPQASTLPGSWACSPQTGGTFCSTNDPIAAASNTNLTIAFDASLAGIGNYQFNANLQDPSFNETNTSNNDITTEIALVAAGIDPDVDINKSFQSGVFFGKAGAYAEINTLVTYEILVRNNTVGSNPATNVVIDDFLPAGVTFDSFNEIGPNFNCSFSPAPIRGGDFVSCTATSLPNTIADDGVQITVNVDGPLGTFIDNTATVFADNDVTPGNNASSSGQFEVVAAAPQVDLVMFKDAESLTGVPGTDFLVNEHFNYALTITNSGVDSAPAAEVFVSDFIPSGVDVVNITSAVGWDCSSSDLLNGIIDCVNTVALDPLTDYPIVIEVVSQVAGNYDNLAGVDLDLISFAIDTNPNNNFDNVIVDITSNGLVDLDLLKDAQTVGGSTSVVNFLVGESFEYKLVVHNTGPNAAPIGDVVVNDILPAGIVLDGTPNGAGWDCSGTVGTTVNCVNTQPIAGVSGFLTIIIPVSSQTEGNYLNSADVSVMGGSLVIDDNPGNNSGSVNVTVGPASGNLTLSKSVIGGTAQTRSKKQFLGNPNFAIGDTVIYTLLAQNTSASNPVNDLVITDVLDTNFLSFDSFNIIQSAANFSCVFDGTSQVTCSNSAGSLFNPGDFFEVEILATAINPGLAVSNTAQLSSVSTGDNFNSNTVLIDIDAGVLPTTLSVDKQALVNGQSVTSVTKGTGFNYRVNIQNTGNEAAQNITLVDNMPTGVIVNSAAGTGWNCSNSGQQYTCDLSGDLLPSESTFVVFGVVDDSTAGTTQLQNVVDVSADNATLVSDVNTINLTLNQGLDYSISIVDSSDPVIIGSTFMYDVTINNTGTMPISVLDFDVALPIQLILDSFTENNTGCIPVNNGLSCQLTNGAIVAPGSNMNLLNMVVTVPDFIGDVTANVTAIAEGSLSASASQTTSIIPIASSNADITLLKTASVENISVNENFNYILTVTNNSNFEANAVVVTDILPKGLVLNAVNANGWTCVGNSTVICSISIMDANSTSSIILDVDAPPVSGNILNSANVSINGQDPVPSDNASEVNVFIETGGSNISDLSIEKSASSKSVISGEEFSWNIEITNNGPDNAQNIIVSDQLPEGFNLISATIDGGQSCQTKTSNLVCFTGSLDVDGTQSVTVTGTSTLDSGVLENTATVTSDSGDPDTTNNSSTGSIMVDPIVSDSADMSVIIVKEAQETTFSVAVFDVQVSNNGPDAAHVPTLNMLASGDFNLIEIDNGSDWMCQVAKLAAITCDYNGTDMPSGSLSSVQVKLKSTGQGPGPSGDSRIVSLTATVESLTPDAIPGNNSATSDVEIAKNPTEEEILSALQAALTGIGSQQTQQAIINVASYCSNDYEGAIEGLCQNLFEAAVAGQGQEINEVMEQITPNDVIAQSSSVSEMASAQFKNVGSRLSQLRGGGGSGFSSAGLNARSGNGSIPLGMLAYLNESAQSDGSQSTDADFISPWGFFVNGSISMGDRDATGRELGFDFDTYGLTAGVDYRLDANKVLGVALGYANFDSKTNDRSTLESTGLTLTGYGSFYVKDNFYVDTRISIAKPDFDQSRKIDFNLNDISVNRTALGNTDADQYSIAMSAGYHINKNAWNITPNASVNYVKTNIDGFSETGAGEYNFSYSEQEIESLVWSVGMKVAKAVSLKNGVITPQFDFDYNYESLNDGNDILARFIMAPEDEVFIIETDSPDRTYGSAGVGLVYISSNGKQAYVNYRSILGLEGFSRGTFNIGARFEF